MPKSPQKSSFPNRTLLGLERDTPEHVVYPCESCFNSAILTRSCGLPL
ncbi:hypothetical protein F383_10826 [Gossypium arboreum]|uniref:Uncharacterized protein n=1 Tax=Gossypium arboreum TaxID=29729 RepID=A0A0B0NQ56_GOSAR|nr:hypothetical protein F383_09284 [Gossypium arboreum]KHG28166.1 hypothetical protein F383_10826 [Gossypium arboreum]